MKKIIYALSILAILICSPVTVALNDDDYSVFRGMKYTADPPSEIHKFRIEHDLANNGCNTRLIIFQAGKVFWVGLLGEGEFFYSSENFDSGSATAKSVDELFQSRLTTIEDVVETMKRLGNDFSDPMYMRDFLKYMTFC